MERCQYRRMSKQERREVAGCCAALSTPLDLSVTAAAESARIFKALGDPVRLRLLSLLAARQGGEVCVCDLTPAFELSQPTISHHLKLLRQAGLIDCERRGTWVYYWVRPEALTAAAALLRHLTPGASPERTD